MTAPADQSIRLGLKIPLDGTNLGRLRETVEAAGSAGFTDLWTSETAGSDAFTPLAAAATSPGRLRLGTGVAGCLTRGSALLCQQAAALQDLSEGRFVLGIGTSSRTIVEGWNGCSFHDASARLGDRLADLRAGFRGEETARGFKLERPPRAAPPIIVAALGPRALATAAACADGVIFNLVPRAALPDTVALLGSTSQNFEIASYVTWYVGEPEDVGMTARWTLAAYAAVPAYAASLARAGCGPALSATAERWARGQRAAAADLVPWDLVRDVYAVGGVDTLEDALLTSLRAGVTTPIVEIVAPGGGTETHIEAAGAAGAAVIRALRSDAERTSRHPLVGGGAPDQITLDTPGTAQRWTAT